MRDIGDEVPTSRFYAQMFGVVDAVHNGVTLIALTDQPRDTADRLDGLAAGASGRQEAQCRRGRFEIEPPLDLGVEDLFGGFPDRVVEQSVAYQSQFDGPVVVEHDVAELVDDGHRGVGVAHDQPEQASGRHPTVLGGAVDVAVA